MLHKRQKMANRFQNIARKRRRQSRRGSLHVVTDLLRVAKDGVLSPKVSIKIKILVSLVVACDLNTCTLCQTLHC